MVDITFEEQIEEVLDAFSNFSSTSGSSVQVVGATSFECEADIDHFEVSISQEEMEELQEKLEENGITVQACMRLESEEEEEYRLLRGEEVDKLLKIYLPEEGLSKLYDVLHNLLSLRSGSAP
ncbi:MAG: hypothetical protein K0U37_08900 [Gammaproteobacteria bacterium]|nr:hypothetical protein [Gammaproteobacteria bacterium]